MQGVVRALTLLGMLGRWHEGAKQQQKVGKPLFFSHKPLQRGGLPYRRNVCALEGQQSSWAWAGLSAHCMRCLADSSSVELTVPAHFTSLQLGQRVCHTW